MEENNEFIKALDTIAKSEWKKLNILIKKAEVNIAAIRYY